MRVVLSLVLGLSALISSPVQASPMWEQAERWTCSLERHLRVPPGADVDEMNPGERSYQIDFKAGNISSAFISGRAEIKGKTFLRTQGADLNILQVAWPSGDYGILIREEQDGFWQIGGSGSLGEGSDIWIAIYQCKPGGGNS